MSTADAQVLVATSTLAWGVNTPAHLVIIKGTEFFDAPTRCASKKLLVQVLDAALQEVFVCFWAQVQVSHHERKPCAGATWTSPSQTCCR